MSAGGIKFGELTPAQKAKLPAFAKNATLYIYRLGKYGEHRLARNKGFKENDVILSWDGKAEITTESDILAYGVTKKSKGQTVTVDVLRSGRKVTLKLPMQ